MNINPFDLLKNAQKIQEQMGSMQEKLTEVNVTGSSGGGMVEIDMNGKFDVTAVRIAPEIAGDIDMLQDLIMAAFASGLEKAREAVTKEMGAMAGNLGISGLNLPPGFPGLS